MAYNAQPSRKREEARGGKAERRTTAKKNERR
jgi:hypothetical protein